MIDPTLYGSTGGNVWDFARQEYLSGVTATTVCQRYGMSMSSFRAHARVGGWRRIDRPDCDAPPEDGEFHPDDEIGFADLADQVFMNIRRAVGTRRAAEAASWMRLYDKLCDRGRPDAMAALPDHDLPKPSVAEPEPEPDPVLFLTADEPETVGTPIDDDGAEASFALSDDYGHIPDLDSPDPVFPESISSSSAHPEPVLTEAAASAETDRSDSLDSVFSESAPPSDTAPGPPLFDGRNRESLLLLRQRRLEHGLGVSDLDAILDESETAPERRDPADRPDDGLSP